MRSLVGPLFMAALLAVVIVSCSMAIWEGLHPPTDWKNVRVEYREASSRQQWVPPMGGMPGHFRKNKRPERWIVVRYSAEAQREEELFVDRETWELCKKALENP